MEVELEVVYERWMGLGGQWAKGGDIGGGSKGGGGVMWGLFKSLRNEKNDYWVGRERITAEFLFRLKYDSKITYFYNLFSI